MKLDSKYFDRIRVKPDAERAARARLPKCDWPGCDKSGCHPAPRGRGCEGQYYFYCLDHVREYNKSYNYFAGMSDADVADFQKSALTGHRPTWSVGVNGWQSRPMGAGGRLNGFTHAFGAGDPFGLFDMAGDAASMAGHGSRRPLRNAERKSLRALDLDETASAVEIKSRFKTLVKRHHPDRNGGDRRSEDKLREVIQAYNYLKQAGFC